MGLLNELREFLKQIPDDCSTIKNSVNETVKLLATFSNLETLDQLLQRIDLDLHDWQKRRGGAITDIAYQQKENIAIRQRLDAKIATYSMFLAKESAVHNTRLSGYKNLIAEIFGGDPWQEGVQKADCHVFTFNYDRLFEVVFMDSFKSYDPSNFSLYGQDVLNSGFNRYAGEYTSVNVASNRFCFLKLHGSVGWWAQNRNSGRGVRRYWPTVPVEAMSLQQIEKSIPKDCGGPLGWEPLLTFPDERHGSQEFFSGRGESSGYVWAPYIDAVWHHAATLLTIATEVKVIGYSFNPIDCRHVIDKLLDKTTCKKITIENKDPQSVERNLASYSQFKGRLVFEKKEF